MKKAPYITVAAFAVVALCAIAFAAAPLVPFQNTGNLWVLDQGSGSVLTISPDKEVKVAIDYGTIISATDWMDFDFLGTGIAFDEQGNVYFAAKSEHSDLLKQPDSEESAIFKYANGQLSVLADTDDILPVTNDPDEECSIKGIAFGSDGMLYANDDASEQVIQVHPISGTVTLWASQDDLLAIVPQVGDDLPWVDLNSGIVGGPNGVIYTATDDSQAFDYVVTKAEVVTKTAVNAIFALESAITQTVVVAESEPFGTGNPFHDLDSFMTRGSDGNLYIIDDSGANNVLVVDPETGSVAEFLSEAVISNTMGTGSSPDLEGGIAFDDNGRFFLAEENSDSILVFSTENSNKKTDGFFVFQAPTVTAGSIWISEEDIFDVTGVDPDLEGGIAFAVGQEEEEDDPEIIYHNPGISSTLCFAEALSDDSAKNTAPSAAFPLTLMALGGALWFVVRRKA